MLQWLRLAVFLLVCAAVNGREMECDQVGYNDNCWNAKLHHSDLCLICEIKNKQISESDEMIFIIKNHTAGVMAVRFYGGDITKMPSLIQKKNNKKISELQLFGTKTPVLNSQFFGNSGKKLIFFGISGSDKLKVEGSAFKNCKNLQHLDLSDNKKSSNIAPDAFLGLQKLIELNLNSKDLSIVLSDWFKDLKNLEVLSLNYNQLAEIPDNAFSSLPKLKQLNMFENKIELITKKMFQDNEKLQEIDLSRNNIKEVQSESFKYLSNLTYLNLRGNECVDNKFKNKTLQEIAEGLNACYVISVCIIPQIKNGFIIRIDDDSTIVPGVSFESSSPVQVVCESTFNQIHNKANQTTNRCLNPLWEDQQWPTCQKLCSKQEIKDESFLAHCDRNGENFPCSGQLLPGIKAIIRCKSGFMNPKGRANPTLTCEESGNWSQSANKCEQIEETSMEEPEEETGVSCSYQEISDISLISFCEFEDADINCTGHLPPDTKVTIRCHFGYEAPPNFEAVLTCEESGEWSSKAYKCKQICGRVATHSVPLQINGKSTNVTEVPWHVGIYEKDMQICGGTIISERVVISAAHCFSQKTDQMHDIVYNNFKVAAGKIVRGLFANETQKTQIRDVMGVEISQKYDGSNTWWADIAAITIKGYFEYQQHIAPACVDFIKNHDEWYPKSESRALVAGWGLDKDFNSSETLQSFDLPVVDYGSCVAEAPVNFKSKVVADKICAGFLDPNGLLTMVVCQGDSGGGLLIPQTVGQEKRYFLQGVVSNAQSVMDVKCQTSFYTLFTNVQHYKNPIIKALKNKVAKTH